VRVHRQERAQGEKPRARAVGRELDRDERNGGGAGRVHAVMGGELVVHEGAPRREQLAHVHVAPKDEVVDDQARLGAHRLGQRLAEGRVQLGVARHPFEAAEVEVLVEELHDGHAGARVVEQAARLRLDASGLVQVPAICRVEQLVVRRAVPEHEREAARHLEAGVAQPRGLVGVGLPQLDAIDEARRLEHASHGRREADPRVPSGEGRSDVDPARDLAGREGPSEGPPAEHLEEAARARVSRGGRLAADERRAPRRVVEHRVHDRVGRLLELLHADLRERVGRRADAREEEGVRVRLDRRRGQGVAEQVYERVPILRLGEPREHRGLERRLPLRLGRGLVGVADIALARGRERHDAQGCRHLATRHEAASCPPTCR
jgi:hypothetical protein